MKSVKHRKKLPKGLVALVAISILMVASLTIQTHGIQKVTQMTNVATLPSSPTTIATSTLSSNTKCISFSNELDNLFNTTIEQVFITMPAKTGGSSLKNFTKECMGEERVVPIDNFLNFPDQLSQLVTGGSTLTQPSIVANHVYNDHTMKKIIQGMTDESILIYPYRHETDRLVSAIQQVVSRLCKGKNLALETYTKYVEYTDTECYIEEDALVDIIRQRELEIEYTIHASLTCSVFDSIEENRPNMVLVHYAQLDRLQKILAKYHCPELMDQSIHGLSLSLRLGKDIYVKLNKDNNPEIETVLLTSWLEGKRHVLEIGLELKKRVTCQGKLRSIEKKLFSCQDELLQFTTDH